MNCAHLKVVDDSLVYSRRIVDESDQHKYVECLHFDRDWS